MTPSKMLDWNSFCWVLVERSGEAWYQKTHTFNTENYDGRDNMQNSKWLSVHEAAKWLNKMLIFFSSPPAAGQRWASACLPASYRDCPWLGPSWSQRRTFWLGGWSGTSWSPRYSILTGCDSYPSPRRRPWTPRWENLPRRPNHWPGTDGVRQFTNSFKCFFCFFKL